MKKISILDTSICDSNMGNQIIMDSIYEILNEMFKEDFFYKLQFSESFGAKSIQILKNSDYVFFGGTNSLSSEMNKYKQMGFSIINLFFFNNLTLFGVGWWQYQKKPNLYTKYFLRRLLSKHTLHSVRDEYTKDMLHKIGINNVLNTSCPTTWSLSTQHCEMIPNKKSSKVVMTLTDYNKHKEFDTKFINILLNEYDTVYIWLQGAGDKDYVNSLDLIDKSRLNFIAPKLADYDKFLNNNEVDYIGTRLHAGIRALQNKKRTLIIAIDNRAKEISRDIGLNIVERDDFNGILSFIKDEYITNINIPIDNINKWKDQYKNIGLSKWK